MIRRILSISVPAASLITAQSAFAHDGEHSGYVFANIMHWLSSPTHSLFAVIAGLGIAAIFYKFSSRVRAKSSRVRAK